jgi:hypothetical protein
MPQESSAKVPRPRVSYLSSLLSNPYSSLVVLVVVVVLSVFGEYEGPTENLLGVCVRRQG